MISTGSPESGRITRLPSRDRIRSFNSGRTLLTTFQKSYVSETTEKIPVGYKSSKNSNVFLSSKPWELITECSVAGIEVPIGYDLGAGS